MTVDSNKPKLCKNCKWCRPQQNLMEIIFNTTSTDGLKFAKCARPNECSIDLITGKQIDSYCSVERLSKCGTDAKYYEEKK